MAQPTGWSPDPISDQSLTSAGSSLVPLPDTKRPRQGEAMAVVMASEAPSGCQEDATLKGPESSDDETSDEEVLRLRLDVERSRLRLAKALKRSSRGSAASRSSGRGGGGRGSGPSASIAEPGGEPETSFNLEEDLEDDLERMPDEHFANAEGEKPKADTAEGAQAPREPPLHQGSLPADGDIDPQGSIPGDSHVGEADAPVPLTHETLNAHYEHVPVVGTIAPHELRENVLRQELAQALEAQRALMVQEARDTVDSIAAMAQHRHTEEIQRLIACLNEEQLRMKGAMIERERVMAQEAESAVQHRVAEYESEAEGRNALQKNMAVNHMANALAEERSKMELLLQREAEKVQKAYQEELERRTNEMNLRFASLELAAKQAEENRVQNEKAAFALFESERTRMEAAYHAAIQMPNGRRP